MSLRRIGSDTLTLFSAWRNSVNSLPPARRAFRRPDQSQNANTQTMTTANPTRYGIPCPTLSCDHTLSPKDHASKDHAPDSITQVVPLRWALRNSSGVGVGPCDHLVRRQSIRSGSGRPACGRRQTQASGPELTENRPQIVPADGSAIWGVAQRPQLRDMTIPGSPRPCHNPARRARRRPAPDRIPPVSTPTTGACPQCG